LYLMEYTSSILISIKPLEVSLLSSAIASTTSLILDKTTSLSTGTAHHSYPASVVGVPKLMCSDAGPKAKTARPAFEQFEDAVAEVESELIKRFSRLREQGIVPDFSMVLASVSPQGKASIYVFDERGLVELVRDNLGFAIIGKGFITEGNLLLRLLGYSPEESYMLDIGALSTFIIDVVSEVDSTVGPFVGESYYMRVEEGKVVLGPLKPEAIKEYKLKAAKRKELLQQIWRLFDNLEEEYVEKVVEELEKKMRKIDKQ